MDFLPMTKFISKKEIQIISSIRNRNKTKCLRNHDFDLIRIVKGRKIRYCSKCILIRTKRQNDKVQIEKYNLQKNKFQFFGVIKKC